MGQVVQCPGCRKSYSLPDRPPPTFTCRACGTTMDLSGLAPPAPADEAQGGEVDEDAEDARRRANVEFGRAERSIQAVQLVFVVGAGLCGVLLFITMALPVDPAVRTNLLLSTGLGACLMGAGAVFVRQEPFVWALVLACAATLGAGLRLLSGGIPWVETIVAFGGWGAVSQAARFRRLLAAHPELKRARRPQGDARRRTKRARGASRGGRSDGTTGRSNRPSDDTPPGRREDAVGQPRGLGPRMEK